MNMLASMTGINPATMQKEIETFQTLAKTSYESLARIEKNTQDNARMLRAICAKLEIEVHNDGSDDNGSGGTRSPGSG